MIASVILPRDKGLTVREIRVLCNIASKEENTFMPITMASHDPNLHIIGYFPFSLTQKFSREKLKTFLEATEHAFYDDCMTGEDLQGTATYAGEGNYTGAEVMFLTEKAFADAVNAFSEVSVS